jgi:hypothetical protein
MGIDEGGEHAEVCQEGRSLDDWSLMNWQSAALDDCHLVNG